MVYDDSKNLVLTISIEGRKNSSSPPIDQVHPFQSFFSSNKTLNYSQLDERDGVCTRREILLRFLLLNAVIDQGPDIEGVRDLLISVTNQLYLNGIRFFHNPLSFFKALGLAIDRILDSHAAIKDVRAEIWAAENRSTPEKYNLFMDNAKQVLNYAVFRWGVPITLPLLLEYDSDEVGHPEALINYLESWNSAEEMSRQLKDHERYGLGKAIGDKACHLFAKWMVSSFRLTRRSDVSWGDLSFEVPYDSNAGRVLWRTGYLLNWATVDDYIKRKVVQLGAGKGGKDYIRVTNIRGMGATKQISNEIKSAYIEIALNHLMTHKRPPKKVEIQRIQHAYLLDLFAETGLSVADFDDGLIYIGTQFCFNHDQPRCDECPVNFLCEGCQSNHQLIEGYRT